MERENHKNECKGQKIKDNVLEVGRWCGHSLEARFRDCYVRKDLRQGGLDSTGRCQNQRDCSDQSRCRTMIFIQFGVDPKCKQSCNETEALTSADALRT